MTIPPLAFLGGAMAGTAVRGVLAGFARHVPFPWQPAEPEKVPIQTDLVNSEPEQRLGGPAAELFHELTRLISESGLEADLPFQIELGNAGEVLVTGHPQAGKIEQLLADHPTLVHQLRSFASEARLNGLARQFHQTYAAEPERAGGLLTSDRAPLVLQVGPRGLELIG